MRALLEITEILQGTEAAGDEQVLRSFNNCLTDFAVGYSIATEIRETVPGHDGVSPPISYALYVLRALNMEID